MPTSFETLANPARLGAVAIDLFRNHRPTVEPVVSRGLDGPEISSYAVYDMSMAVYDALEKSSISAHPSHSKGLLAEVTKLGLKGLANYDEILERRYAKRMLLEEELRESA